MLENTKVAKQIDNPEKTRAVKRKKNKTQTQHNMCWTPL